MPRTPKVLTVNKQGFTKKEARNLRRLSEHAERMSPTYLQFSIELRKRNAKCDRKKNGQRSWLVR